MIYCNSYDEAKLEAIHLISDYDNCIKNLVIEYDKRHGWYVEYMEYKPEEREELYI